MEHLGDNNSDVPTWPAPGFRHSAELPASSPAVGDLAALFSLVHAAYGKVDNNSGRGDAAMDVRRSSPVG